eukprot:Plantae.Rhodophyta-Hildenbrandia_rubra.ctg7354.p2 GENE.Plantae.Rhodophyta-Hildenbrandia_rubra.ctg7354~~Plantae.Rhodophyta-Hildenbrandia_rubra.ctg7354.p2  ORF type:complete len:328 (-),score=57.13 Plantae.Rhodophyta-Hildenbrandia_rubra.ctg7354:2786-3769(-)
MPAALLLGLSRHSRLASRAVGLSARSFTTSSPISPLTSGTQQPRSPFATLLVFTVPIITTIGLGTWQVQRLQGKKELIAARERQLSLPPLQATDLKAKSNETLSPDLEYRRVILQGQWDHEKEMLVGPRSAPGDVPSRVLQWGGSMGFNVVTPMLVKNEGAIENQEEEKIFLINRGWVPQRLEKHVERSKAEAMKGMAVGDGEEDGVVEVVGILRRGDDNGYFTPENIPEKDEWFWLDPNAMMEKVFKDRRKGCYVVDLLEPKTRNGWPHPKALEDHMTFRTSPETHIVYAATWYLLASFMIAMSVTRYRRIALRRAKEARLKGSQR